MPLRTILHGGINRMSLNQEPNLTNLIRAFAIGDALGAPFEFCSPTFDEIEKRWLSNTPLLYTDDTFLLLSSVWEIGRAHV